MKITKDEKAFLKLQKKWHQHTNFNLTSNKTLKLFGFFGKQSKFSNAIKKLGIIGSLLIFLVSIILLPVLIILGILYLVLKVAVSDFDNHQDKYVAKQKRYQRKQDRFQKRFEKYLDRFIKDKDKARRILTQQGFRIDLEITRETIIEFLTEKDRKTQAEFMDAFKAKLADTPFSSMQ